MRKLKLFFACMLLTLLSIGQVWAEKITDYSNIVAGNYYIGATTGGTDYYLSVDGSNTSTSIAGTAVTSSASATVFTFAGSGTSWTIQFPSGKYLSLKNGKDNGKVQVVESAATFTASNQSSKIRLTIGNYSVQKNNSGTQFGSYGNTQTDLWLEPAGTSQVTVSLDPDGGNFTGSVEVTITPSTGATAYYTTDATKKTSPSTTTWTAYNASAKPTFTETTTIWVAAVKDATWSDVVEKTFTKVTPVTSYDIDFETNDLSLYVNWDFTNAEVAANGANTNISAHGGTHYGTTGGKATAAIKTHSKIASPGTLSCYVSKQSGNTTSSTWYIQVSEDGSSWTDVETQSATSMDQGNWVEFTADLSDYSNVYVRLYYSGSTAVRNVDDISLEMASSVNKPTISGEENFLTSTTVTLACTTTGATIYYTTDDTDPKTSATKLTYSDPFTLTATTKIRAIAELSGAWSSEATSKTFTKATVLTVAEALAATPAANKYVSGVVASVTEVSTEHGNATYTIKDADVENSIIIYRGKYLNNENFTSVDQIEEGDEVTVFGEIKVHSEVNQFTTGNYIVAMFPKARLSWSAASFEAALEGENTFPTLTNTNGVSVTYSSSNTDAATISNEEGHEGEISLVAAGTTTITATFAGNETYKANSASYTLNIASSLVTLTYNVDGGEAIDPVNVSALPNPLPTTTKAGNNFGGWFTDSEKTIAAVPGTAISENTTLYAKWLDPYTVAEAKAVIDALPENGTIDNQYVSGIISQIDSYNNTYHSITYWISADGTTTNQLQVYSGLIGNAATPLGKEAFSAKEDLALGDEVVVTGTLKLHNSTTYEFDKNNTIYSFSRKASAGLEYSVTAVNKVVGDADFVNELTNPNSVAVTYATSDDQVAEVANDGTVTIIGEGTATITASFAGNQTYKAAQVSYTLIVSATAMTDYYEKVTSTAGIVEGTYLIVYEAGSFAFNGGLETLDAANNTISVTIVGSKIAVTSDTEAATFYINPTAGTIQAANGMYIGVSSNSNGLKTSEDADTYTNAFAIDDNGNAVISAVFENANMTLRYNANSGQNRFRYFGNGQQPIALYKLANEVVKTDPELSWGVESFDAYIGQENTFPTLTKPQSVSIVYSSSNTAAATIDPATGDITLGSTPNVSTTITATLSNDETYKDDVASYTLNVYMPVNPGTITYEENGGSEVADVTEAVSYYPESLPEPTKENNIFDGWWTTSTFDENTQAVAGAPMNGDVTLYAKWETIPVWAYTYTSNVTLSGAKVKFYGGTTEYDAAKAGSSGSAGSTTITVPANATKLHFHAYGWKGENVGLTVTAPEGVTVSPATEISINSNNGITGNSPFTLTEGADPMNDAYYVVELSGNTSETTLTFTATSGKRFVLFGVNQEGGILPVLDHIAITGEMTNTTGWKTGDEITPEGLIVNAYYTLNSVAQTNPVDVTENVVWSHAALVEDQTEVTLTASYTEGEVTKTATTDAITIEAVETGAPSITTDVNSRSWTVDQNADIPASKTFAVTLKNIASATVTLGGDNPEAFNVSPSTLTASGNITVSVVSTATVNTYSATITIKDDASETSKTVNVNLTVNAPVVEETAVSTTSEWVAATATDLVDGKQVLITGVKDDVTYAMGGQNKNNRAAVAASVDGEDVLTPGENTMSFTLVAQETEGVFALRTSNGKYLYAAASGDNYMKTQDNVDANAQWTISATSAVAESSSNRNVMQFNGGSSLFSCYNTASQSAIQFYIPKPVTPTSEQVIITDDADETAVETDDDVTVKDGGVLTINNAKQVGDVTIQSGGKISAETETLTVKDLTISTMNGNSSTDGKSGQILGTNVNVTGDLYLEIKLRDGDMDYDASCLWYCISAPFDVNMNGGFFWGDGTPMVLNTHFQLFEYDGQKRADTGNGWKRVSGTMKANTAYFIGFDEARNDNQNTIKLKANAKTIPAVAPIALSPYAAADEANANWNAVANPTLRYVGLDKPVQVFDYTRQGYNPYLFVEGTTETGFVVGTPFFYKGTGSIILNTNDHGTLHAPQRSATHYNYCVQIRKAGANRFDNQLYVVASETASATYEEGKDVLTMNKETSTYGALIWTENYGGKRLAIEEAPLVNNQAIYDLGLYAPAAGTYSISAQQVEGATLYVTYNGAIVWNLSLGDYELDLTRGTTTGYGLLLVAQPNQMPTGLDTTEGVAGDAVQKILLNGQLYILRDGHLFDAVGHEMK